MPKSLLILIIAAVIGLSVLTWMQFFQETGPVSPEGERGDASGKGVGRGDPAKGGPVVPVIVPTDVPPAERALELVNGLTLAMLGKGPPMNHADISWLINTEEGVAELMRLLAESEDDNVKAAILVTLGESSIEGTFDTLKGAATGEYGDRLRTAGVLGMMSRQDEAVPVLQEIFLSTQDEGVAAASLQVLSHMNPDQAMAAFGNLLREVEGAVRRDTLYQILGGHKFALATDEPEAAATFRSGLLGMIPPMEDAHPEQMIVIDEIVDMVVREEDPKLEMGAMVVLARMPGEKAREVFVSRYQAADEAHRLGLLGLIHPELSRGKIHEFLRMAPEMENRREREVLSIQVQEWADPRIVDEVRIWRDAEQDEEIRRRLSKTIERYGGR